MSTPVARTSGMPIGGERHAPIATSALNECARMEANLPLIEDPVQFRTQLRVIVNDLLAFTREVPSEWDTVEKAALFDDMWRQRMEIKEALDRGDTEPKTPPVHKQYFVTDRGMPGYVLKCGSFPEQEVMAEDSQWASKQLHAEVDMSNQRKSIEKLLGFHAFLHDFLDWGGVWKSGTRFEFVAPGFGRSQMDRYMSQAQGKIERLPPPTPKVLMPPVEAAFAAFNTEPQTEDEPADDSGG